MSWSELKPMRGRGADAFGVRVSVGDFFVITLGEDVAAVTGWRARSTIKLFFGKGENAGAIRLEPGGKGDYMLLPGSKGAGTLKLRRRLLYPKDAKPHPIERVEWHLAGGGLEINLPSWWRELEGALEPAAAAKPKAVPVVAEPKPTASTPAIVRRPPPPQPTLDAKSKYAAEAKQIAAFQAAKDEAKDRPCLKCGTKFKSKWSGNRICPSCTPSVNSASGGVA